MVTCFLWVFKCLYFDFYHIFVIETKESFLLLRVKEVTLPNIKHYFIYIDWLSCETGTQQTLDRGLHLFSIIWTLMKFKMQMDRFSNGTATHIRTYLKGSTIVKNGTYWIVFVSWNEKGCREVMPLVLSKHYKTRVLGLSKVIILKSYTLEVISQPLYSHKMNPISYDFTNNSANNAF